MFGAGVAFGGGFVGGGDTGRSTGRGIVDGGGGIVSTGGFQGAKSGGILVRQHTMKKQSKSAF